MEHEAPGPTIAAPVSVETLTHAAEVAGGLSRLAQHLKVPERRMRTWMSGLEPVPMNVFMDALDVIADGLEPRGAPAFQRGTLSSDPA